MVISLNLKLWKVIFLHNLLSQPLYHTLEKRSSLLKSLVVLVNRIVVNIPYNAGGVAGTSTNNVWAVTKNYILDLGTARFAR